MTEQGKIYKGIGGFYYVVTASGTIECRARGRFRSDRISPLVGDNVVTELTANGKGYITEILPRKNSFVRPPVSNLDMLVIVASAAPPVTDTFLIDALASTAINKAIEPIILINKCDLDSGDELFETYRNSGIQVIRTSAVTRQGRSELLDILKGHISAFSGNSGVGKSSVLNMVDKRLGIETGEINERIGRGRHTTRHVELFELENRAIVADTPGFSSFETTDVDIVMAEDLQYTFREFEPYLGQCRFTGCAHVKDKDCAVRLAVEEGKISPKRYESYIRLYKPASEYREWEHK